MSEGEGRERGPGLNSMQMSIAHGRPKGRAKQHSNCRVPRNGRERAIEPRRVGKASMLHASVEAGRGADITSALGRVNLIGRGRMRVAPFAILIRFIAVHSQCGRGTLHAPSSSRPFLGTPSIH